MMIIRRYFQAGQAFTVNHWRLLAGLAAIVVIVPLSLLIISTIVVGGYQRDVRSLSDTPHVAVGLVLGAGITPEGQPYRELQARLDIAAQAVQDGRVDKLILSGDNRFVYYDEPSAMKNYLVNVKHIPADKLQPDYAGRDTYDSCKRASKVFGFKQTVIFSAGSHLPRAIFLCDHLGVHAYGVSSGVEAENAWRREPLARVKAVLDTYLLPHKTILGPAISV